MSTTDFPPCGWNAFSGLQYLQAVQFAPPPSNCQVGLVCSPPAATCTCPPPVPPPGGFWVTGPPPPPAPPPQPLPKPAGFAAPKFSPPPGVNFIPPKNVSTLFIFTEVGPPKKDGSLKFQPWQIDSTKTVQDILEHLGKGEDRWSLVEYHELGDGNWNQGITVGYKDERAKKGISKFGWTPRRGGMLPPVWLATETE